MLTDQIYREYGIAVNPEMTVAEFIKLWKH